MRRGGLLALMAALGACLPGTALAAGDSLQLVGQPQIDRKGILLPASWISITGSAAVWDTPGWRGDYRWSIPDAIPPGGADATLSVKATDKVGGRFYPVIGVSGNVFIEGGDGIVTAGADLNAGKPTAEGNGTFKLVPGSYCDTCPITVTVGIQDGPRITFNYKVVPKPRGKPCKAGAITRIAQFNGPLLCYTDEPAPGKTGRVTSSVLEPKAKALTADVTSSAGSLGGTTIVGEAEAIRRRADRIGTVVAACYLIGPDVFDYPPDHITEAVHKLIDRGEFNRSGTPSGRLRNCIALAKILVEPEGPEGPAGAAAAGCRVRRIALAGPKLAKSQRPSSGSVRYRCARVRGGLKLTVKRSQGLRSAIGKKLDLGVVRSPTAPASGSTLSFRFR
jgi:hypothetical protein